jgi:ATP-binding cassette subfamily C protein CydCD
MKNLRKFLRQEAPKILSAAIIGGLSMSTAVGLLAASSWLISMASLRPPILVLEVAIVAVRFFGLSRGVLRYGSRLIEHNSALRVLTKIRSGIYLHLEAQLQQYFSHLRRGELLRRIVADSETLQDLWLRIANPWLGALISGVAGLGIVYALVPALGSMLALIFLTTIFVIPALSISISSNQNQRLQEEILFDAIIQASDSVQESLIFGYQVRVRGEIEVAQNQLNRIDRKSGIAIGSANFIASFATGASIIVATSFAISAFQDHALAGVNVAVVILLPLAIFDGLSGLPAAFARLATIMNSTKSVNSLLTVEANSQRSLQQQLWGNTITVEFQGVVPILPNTVIAPFSGVAKPGTPLVITGKSGAGKSSLVHALIGFLDYEGEILFGAFEAKAVASEARISQCSVLLQQDYLFATSIRENLRIGLPGASDEVIFQALELVELTQLITKVGLDTHIGAYGHNFSGGEKQRLKLARTLLRERPLVILDEPFEYLDFEQAQRISNNVIRHCANRTLIIVSHLPVL